MKTLIYIVLLNLPTLCGLAQNTINYKGNTIEFSSAESVEVYNPISGQQEQGSKPSQPITLNGASIYDMHKCTDGPLITKMNGKAVKLSDYLFMILSPQLEQLNDGNYIIQIIDAVVDAQGRLVYFKTGGIKQRIASYAKPNTKTDINGNTPRMVTYIFTDKDIDSALAQKINVKAQQSLEHIPHLIPAQINGQAVNSTGELFNSLGTIKVKAHKVSYDACYFCL